MSPLSLEELEELRMKMAHAWWEGIKAQGCILTLLLAKTMKKIPSKNDRHDVANLIMC
jgi:hypothetical protein